MTTTDRVFLAIAVLLAGCASADPAGFQMVVLSGAVVGDGEADPTECGAYLPYDVDLAERRVAYDASALGLPGAPALLLLLDGSFTHPRTRPCLAFDGLEAPQPPYVASLRVAPFDWSVPFTVDGGFLVVSGERVAPGERWNTPVDLEADGIRYRGTLVLENAGRWPSDALRGYASQEAFLAR